MKLTPLAPLALSAQSTNFLHSSHQFFSFELMNEEKVDCWLLGLPRSCCCLVRRCVHWLNSWFVLFHFTSFHSTKTNSFKFNQLTPLSLNGFVWFEFRCFLLFAFALCCGALAGSPPITHNSSAKRKQLIHQTAGRQTKSKTFGLWPGPQRLQ